MAKRGELTQEIKALSKELMGYEIDKTELRLMPYFQHVMVNSQEISMDKVNLDERKIMTKWQEKGWIEKGQPMYCTQEFWDILNKIIFVAYVDYKNKH